MVTQSSREPGKDRQMANLINMRALLVRKEERMNIALSDFFPAALLYFFIA